MAVRFKAKATGVNGTSKTIEIDDSGTFVPPAEPFISLSGAGIRLSYQPESEHPHAPVIPSTLTFELIQNPSNASKINDLIGDIISSEEGRFRALLKDSSGALEWIGYIMSDQIRRQDRDWADTASAVRIRAKDGVNRLKNVEFGDPGVTLNNRRPIIDYLFDVIDDIGHADYFGASDDYLKTIVRWYEANMDSPAITDSPLSFAEVGKEAFRSRDNSGGDLYIDSYEVLKTICVIFGARFYLSGGSYRFEQVGEYRENGSIYQHRYYKDRTLHNTDSSVDLAVSESSSAFTRAAEGEYGYFAPLRDVELTSKHRKSQNYLRGAEWSDSSSQLEELGTVGTVDAALSFSGTLTTKADIPGFVPCRHLFAMRMKAAVGSTVYYLGRSYTLGPGSTVNFTPAEWTTDSTALYYFITNPQPSNNAEQAQSIGIITPDLPTDAPLAAIEVQVLYSDTVKLSNGGAMANVSITWLFSQTSVELQSDENSEEISEGTISLLINPDFSDVSQTLELETLIADGPNLANAAAITTDPGIGSPPVPTEEWTKGLSGAGKRIQYLLLEEIMKYRKTAILKWSGDLVNSSSYKYHNLMQLNTGDVFVPLACEYTLGGGVEQWKGVWFKSGYADTGISAGNVVDYEIGGLQPGGGPFLTGGGSEPSVNVINDVFDAGGQIGGIISGDIIEGDTVTSIPIEPIGVTGLISSGDNIKLASSLGSSQNFTVTADVGASDTAISVASTTASESFGAGSYVAVANSDYVSNIQSGASAAGKVLRYRQVYDNVSASSLPVTVNGGTLPANTDLIDVHYNGRLLVEGASHDYEVSGSNINFTFTPRGKVTVVVTFWIIQ